MTTMFATMAIGVLLGLRFKVFVLVPAIAISLGANFAIGIAKGSGIWPILFSTFITIAGLQIGYLVGVAIRFAVVRTRARRDLAGIAPLPQRR